MSGWVGTLEIMETSFWKKLKLGALSCCTYNSKASPERPTLTVVELHRLSDFGKFVSEGEISWLKWTLDDARRKVFVISKTDADTISIGLLHQRNNLHLKDNEIDLKFTGNQTLLANRIFLSSYLDIFFKQCFVLDETTVLNQNKFRQEWLFFF